MSVQPVLIDGQWRPSQGQQTFQAVNPRTRELLPGVFPVSPWSEIEQAVQAAHRAFVATAGWPGERFARFLEVYANLIDAHAAELVAAAHAETALPVEPRLAKAELPRTSNQLRQAAAAARDGTWKRPIVDTQANIRSIFGPLGPVVVFGPNNFPFAFNGMAGGDFAAAIAAGNPVLAKGHSSHPETTRLFAMLAQQAAVETGLPPGFVQLVYRTSHADGTRLVAHERIAATGYTGARQTGLVLKQAADAAGKPIYLELSSINPIVLLPGAIAGRGAALADEFTGSCLMGTGQFCTNPGLVVALHSPATLDLLELVGQKFATAPVGTLLGEGVLKHLEAGVQTLRSAGAEVVAGGAPGGGQGFSYRNTLLKVSASRFLADRERLQTEAFGNCSLWVLADSADELLAVLEALEGNLTGSIYSATDGSDESLYARVEPVLRRRVGRLLTDKMPTGVAVSPAMNHGGPFPATGHPGFTAVGLPVSIQRFAMLQCYDGVRDSRLPPELRNANPTGQMWRLIDGTWSTAHIGG